jgi:endonuclease/exonuclease/phosphatase family metal-dependent hydrolase
VVNLQHLPGRMLALFDADGNPSTGAAERGLDGVDVIIEFTPPSSKAPDRPGMGVGLRSPTYQPDPTDASARKLTLYDAGVTFAPTYASERFELRVARGVRLPQTAPLFEGSHFSFKLVFLDLAQQLADETPVAAARLDAPFSPNAANQTASDPLARADGTAMRVLQWNVEFGSVFSKPELYRRLLRAIDPDTILFEELSDKQSGEALAALLNEWLADRKGTWKVIWGEGGGDLRCAVASRLDVRPVDALRYVAHADTPDRALRLAAGTIDVAGARVLVAAVHLKCCGSAGSSEDITRIAEVRLLRQAMAAAQPQAGWRGVIVGGDFNLVGSRAPLDLLIDRLDADGSAAAAVNPLQLDGRSNATWADPDQPFAPGRLDFVVFSDSALVVKRSFVFDSSDVASDWLEQHALQPGDTAEASDHLPVVVDFAHAARGPA